MRDVPRRGRGLARAHDQRVQVVSGGWCDFFHTPPQIEETFRSIDRQVEMARTLGAGMLRLFFGRLPRESYGSAARGVVIDNLQRLAGAHPTMMFVFENHDGASLVPEICREVIAGADRANIRMNFVPINFARVGVDPESAAELLQPLIAHMHLKGLEAGEYCEFGTGDVDLTPTLTALARRGYRGDVTVEYEGPFDGTLRLYESVKRARTIAASLE